MSVTGDIFTPLAPVERAKDRVTIAGRWRKLVIRGTVTLALLLLLFWQVRWQDVWVAVQTLDRAVFVIAVVLAVPTQYFQYVKWASLAREAGPGVSQGDIQRGFWVGYTLGLVTPGRIGQYGRALALRNCSLARAAGLTFIERSYSAIVVNALGLLALVFLPALGWISPFPVQGSGVEIALIVAVTGLVLVGLFPRGFGPLVARIAARLPLGDKLARAVTSIEVVTPGRGLWLMALATLGLASAVLQFVVLLWALGSPVPLVAGMLAGLLSFFLRGSLPIAIGNLGIGEWTAMLCLAGLGVPASVAVTASLLLFTINVFVPGLIGLPFVASLRTPSLGVAGKVTA